MSLEDLLRVPVVVTASRQEEAITDTPATTVVITREDIRLRGYAFLKDVLRDLPGMETSEYYFSEFGTLVPVRGVVGNNKIIVLVNGMRVNPPGGESMMLRSDISVRDAEQIEVVYGPGSTIYGQDAISAVINVITRKAAEDNAKIPRGEFRKRFLEPIADDAAIFRVGAELGYPLKTAIWGSLNLRFGGARVFANVSYIDQKLTDLSTTYPQHWAQYEALAAGKGLATTPQRFDNGLNIMVRIEAGSASLQLWHRQSARISSEGYGLPNLPYVNEARWQDMSTVAEARHTLKIGKYVSLDSSLTFNRYEVDPSTRYVFDVPSSQPGQPGVWELADFKYARGISGALEEKLTVKVGDKLSVYGGFFAAHYDVLPKSTVLGGADLSRSVPEEGGVATYYTAQGDPNSRVDIPNVSHLTYQDFGGYLEANWRIIKRLRLVAGLRIDKNTQVDDVAFSPRAALIFNSKGFTARYSFARAFVAPPPYFKYNVYFRGDTLNIANPALSPETTLSNEIFLAYENRFVRVSAAGYYNLQDNLLFEGDRGLMINILQNAWLDPAGTSRVTLTHSANAGSSRAIGFDLAGRFNVWKLSGWASYSYVDFVATIDGQELPTVSISRHNFRVGATVSILRNLFATVSASVRSIPENLPTPDHLAGLIDIPWELNAHFVYSPIPCIDLFADLRNFTNHPYYLASLLGTPYPIQAFQGSGGFRFRF